MISPLTLDQVRAATNLIQLVRSYGIELRRAGSNLVGRCPFHREATPSFKVTEKFFKCWGCGAGGDVFRFVQRIEGLRDFSAAVQMLAGRAGIPITPPTAQERRIATTARRIADDVGKDTEFTVHHVRAALRRWRESVRQADTEIVDQLRSDPDNGNLWEQLVTLDQLCSYLEGRADIVSLISTVPAQIIVRTQIAFRRQFPRTDAERRFEEDHNQFVSRLSQVARKRLLVPCHEPRP